MCHPIVVTWEVTKPVSENDTHWCAEVEPRQMVEWCLSELAEVKDSIVRP
jgi:hypothetical protein